MKITVDGVEVTTGIEYNVSAPQERPDATLWQGAYVLSGKTGILIDATTYSPGVYAVWARVSSTPETVVIPCGKFTIA